VCLPKAPEPGGAAEVGALGFSPAGRRRGRRSGRGAPPPPPSAPVLSAGHRSKAASSVGRCGGSVPAGPGNGALSQWPAA